MKYCQMIVSMLDEFYYKSYSLSNLTYLFHETKKKYSLFEILIYNFYYIMNEKSVYLQILQVSYCIYIWKRCGHRFFS